MSLDVFDGLRDAAARAAQDVLGEEAVGAVLVRGSGAVFSSGIDLSTFAGQQEDGQGLDLDFVDRLQSAFTAYEDLDVPTIAQVEGYCFGAGLQLATACHVRLVTPDAQLSLMEVRWGLVPDLGATVRLPRLIGLGRATELALTARKVSAHEALAMGLCEVALPAEGAGEAALAYAARLAAGPSAVRRVPRMFRENVGRDRADALLAERMTQSEVTSGPDHREALAAGMEGRAPVFSGR
jgi:enoyl-CoA hydratase/carnithine racemase